MESSFQITDVFSCNILRRAPARSHGYSVWTGDARAVLGGPGGRGHEDEGKGRARWGKGETPRGTGVRRGMDGRTAWGIVARGRRGFSAPLRGRGVADLASWDADQPPRRDLGREVVAAELRVQAPLF